MKIFRKKVAQCRKLYFSRLLFQTFLNQNLFQNFVSNRIVRKKTICFVSAKNQRGTSIEKISGEKSHSAEKNQRGTFWSPSTFASIKKFGLERDTNSVKIQVNIYAKLQVAVGRHNV